MSNLGNGLVSFVNGLFRNKVKITRKHLKLQPPLVCFMYDPRRPYLVNKINIMKASKDMDGSEILKWSPTSTLLCRMRACVRYTWGQLFKKSFCWTKVQFVGPLVPSVSESGWLCPWVWKPGWIHRHLRSFVACGTSCAQGSPESSLVAEIGHQTRMAHLSVRHSWKICRNAEF